MASRGLDIGAVQAIAAAAGLGLIAFRGLSGSVGLTHGLLLVPFFMSAVPAISSLVGDGLYQWNKWHVRFERYDAEAHPRLARLLQAFWIVATGIFTYFVLALDH